MNAYEEMMKGIKWVLDNCTSYQVSKDLNITNRSINRYQNGTSPIENMTLKTAGLLYNYYLKEMKKMKKALIETHNNYTLLIDLDDIEEKVYTDGIMAIRGIKPTKELIDELNKQIEGYMSYHELENFLEKQGFDNFEIDEIGPFCDPEPLLIYDYNIYEFYNLADCETEQVYEWMEGTNKKTEIIESVTEIVVDEDYVSLDAWDGSNFTFNNDIGRHARVYKVIESDYGDDDLYLIEYWSQWQGEHATGEVKSREELIEFLQEHDLDAEEILKELEDEAN